jgi:hypothetical protein
MKYRLRVGFALLAAAALGAHGQDEADWGRLGGLGAGNKVKLYLQNGVVLKGTVRDWEPEGISLLTGENKVVAFRAEEVARVTKKSRARGALWGAIVGFGIAAPVGAYVGPYTTDWSNPPAGTRLRHAVGWGAFFSGVGAGIGLLTGVETTIYRMQPRPKAFTSRLP